LAFQLKLKLLFLDFKLTLLLHELYLFGLCLGSARSFLLELIVFLFQLSVEFLNGFALFKFDFCLSLISLFNEGNLTPYLCKLVCSTLFLTSLVCCGCSTPYFNKQVFLAFSGLADKLFVPMLLGMAFAEAIAIYALVVTFIL
jgi:hypothetical protein